MKVLHRTAFRLGLPGLLLGSLGLISTSKAAISTVSVGDNFFSPSSLTINVNDRVRWTWTGGNSHSTTSTGGLWDSGVHGNGFTFTNTFGSAGNFPYRCTIHASQAGSVTVQNPNVLPSVSITLPTAGAVFAAPWLGSIRANTSDSDGSVLKVDFFADTTRLGTVSNPPPQVVFTLTNIAGGLAAGNYVLKAVAMDNRGATNTSATVAISVLTPGPIMLSAPSWTNAASFHFSYSATVGLRYVIRKATVPGNWNPLATNTATGALMAFTDSNAAPPFGLYSVMLAPNP